MRILATGLVALLSAASAVSAAAADRKVPSTDYPTIQSAADAASSGDRILVGKGTFNENVTLNQSNVQIIAKGSILDGNLGGTNGVCLTVNGDGCSVTGMTFRHGSQHLVVTGTTAHVSRCRFLRTGNYQKGVSITGDGAVITGCTSTGALDTAFYVSGTGASISKNKISQCGEQGIVVSGASAVVTKNSVFNIEDSEGILVTGAGAIVTGNKVGYLDGSGISVDSDDCTVTGNSIVAAGDYCLKVTGDRVAVTGNKVSHAVDDADSLYVKSRTTAGGGSVEGNLVTDGVEYGIYVNNGYNLAIRGNTVQRCGAESEASFYLTGDNNTIEGNLAQDGEDDGFYVSGNDNTLTGNKAVNCLTDGFDIDGTGNSLDGCSATGCGGEGLDNGGTGTNVQNCTFLKNRIDLAADLANGATFGTVSNNKSVTGGTTTQTEVD